MATSKVRQYRITFKNIKEGEIPCSNPIVKLFDIADNIVQKCEFKNNSVVFSIYEDAIEGLQGTCIQFSVVCENCGKCPQKNGKICFCNDFTDCEECQDCINGICVNRCPNQLCDDDKCVDCTNSDDCPNNQVCIGGKCQCPPTQPYFDEVTQKCYGCQTDNECGPCYRCIDGNCVRLNCICDEDLNKCVECVKSSDCPLPNQCCVGNKCVCCPGYIWDPVLEQCVIEPECTDDDDCQDPCKICVNGNCVDIICPVPGEVCTNGICGPVPCEGPCDDATDCGPDCGCLNGQCVDCSSLDCDTCQQAVGCKCVNGECEKDNDPCAQYTCETNCGERPDCACVDGKCEGVDCEGQSTLAKNEEECKLEYNLETTKCCECPDVTLDNKLIGAATSGTTAIKLTSRVEVRKGAVTDPLGILNIHRVDEDQYDDIMDNEEATQGQVRVVARYTYEGLSNSGTPNGIFTTEDVTLTPTFDVAGVGFDQEFLFINAPGMQVPLGVRVIRSVTLTYTLISELTFESQCTYNQNQIVGTYTFTDLLTRSELIADININTPGQDSNIKYWIAKTVTSDACRVPEARWFKAPADAEGNITVFEPIPFRKTYLTKLTSTTYTDFIDEPDENPGPTDNNGELFSGYFYKVATDCACTNEATAYYESTCENPGRVVFCDPMVADIIFDPCGRKITFDSPFVTDCLPNYDYYGDNADFVPDDAQLRYSIHVNGSDTPLAGSTKIAASNGLIYAQNQMFTSTELIEFIEIRFSHDNCDECTIRVESDVELEIPSYIVVCEPSGTSNTTYTITFTSWTGITSVIVNGHVATSGSPTVTLTVANTTTTLTGLVLFTGCPGTVAMLIVLPENCCDDLIVTITQNTSDCESTTYDFEAFATPDIPGVFSFSVDGVFVTSNSTGLLSIPRDLDNNIVSVSFNPDAAGCETVTNSTEIDHTEGRIVESDSPSSIVLCGSATRTVTFNTIGFTGNVSYTVTGEVPVIESLDGTEELEISVSGDPDDTKFITITSDSLVDGDGNDCVDITPLITTIQWIDEPTIDSVDFDVTDACEGDEVNFTVMGTGSTATVEYTNFLGSNPTTVNIGQTYTVLVGSSTDDAIITVTSASAGDCTVIVNVGASVNVLDDPEITNFEHECETPGSPSSDILVTVIATEGAVVTVLADEGNVILTESEGEYTGSISSANGGNTVTVTVVLGDCSTEESYEIVGCACDDEAEVEMCLDDGFFIPLVSLSGCVGSDTDIVADVTGGNAPYNYEWELDGVLQDTGSVFTYVFISGAHTLSVTVTDDEGCVFSDVMAVIGNPLPVPTVVGSSTPCLNEETTYTVSFTNGPLASFEWFVDTVTTGITTSTFDYTPTDTDPHDITVVVTNGNGCGPVESAIKTVTAVDCCVLCDAEAFAKDSVAYNRIKDINNIVYNISGAGSLSGNGPFTSVTFECVASPDPSTQNDDAVLDLQEAIAAFPGQCGEPEVTWDYGASGSNTDCLSEIFNVTSGTSGVWFRGFEVNGNQYQVNSKIVNATAGLLTNPIPLSSAEATILQQLEYALNQEGVGCISKTVQLTGTAGTSTLSHGIEIVGIIGATVKYLYSTTSNGTIVPVDVNDTSCGAVAGGSTVSGGCILISVVNTSIPIATIYASPGSANDISGFIGSCTPA